VVLNTESWGSDGCQVFGCLGVWVVFLALEMHRRKRGKKEGKERKEKAHSIKEAPNQSRG